VHVGWAVSLRGGGLVAPAIRHADRLSLDELMAVDMRPYREAIDAGVLTVMASFNSWQGTKCHGSHALLTDVLKGTLGFRGLVVSDWDGVDQVHPDRVTAVAQAVNAGVDIIMVSADWRGVLAALDEAVTRALIPMARIDDAVRQIVQSCYIDTVKLVANHRDVMDRVVELV
jgi:beta-glucosidase